MTKAKSQPAAQALGSIFGTGARRVAAAGSRPGFGPGGPPAAVPASAASPGVAAVLAVVDRLEAVLDAETEAVKRGLPADMAEIGNRKRQGLLEMDRALRAAPAGPAPEIRERLRRFSGAVERNRAALGTQLRALREIADIVAQTLREAESDGTYAPASPFSTQPFSSHASAAGRA